MIESVVQDMNVLLAENLNPICKEEIKKEIDETVNSEKHMLRNK